MGESKERPWGKINRRQPYVVITRDLLRAFFHAKMNADERKVFEYVLEHSWGDATRGKKGGDPWPDALPCEMNLYALVTAWHIDYANLKKARTALVADRLLICSSDRYFINKDVDTWAKYRITPDSLEHAAEAIRTGKLPESNSYPLGVDPTPKCTQLGVNHTPNVPRYNGVLGVDPTPTKHSSSDSHIGTRAPAELNSIQFNSEDSLGKNAPEDPQLVLILGWVRSAVEKGYPGDECLLEAVLLRVRSWVILEGYHPADISEAIHETIGRKKPSMVLLSYSKTILDGLRLKREAGRPAPQASSFKAEPVANKTKLKTYLEPIERPSPPNVDPKGKTR